MSIDSLLFFWDKLKGYRLEIELYLEIVVQGSHACLQIIFVLLGDFEIQNSLNLKEVSSHDRLQQC